jgi:hypothetical protein
MPLARALHIWLLGWTEQSVQAAPLTPQCWSSALPDWQLPAPQQPPLQGTDEPQAVPQVPSGSHACPAVYEPAAAQSLVPMQPTHVPRGEHKGVPPPLNVAQSVHAAPELPHWVGSLRMLPATHVPPAQQPP